MAVTLSVVCAIGCIAALAEGAPAQRGGRAGGLGSLIVLVRDARTKRPVPLASVHEHEQLAGGITDEFGSAALNRLTPGIVHVRVSLRPYVARLDSIRIRAGRQDTLRIALRPDTGTLKREETMIVNLNARGWSGWCFTCGNR